MRAFEIVVEAGELDVAGDTAVHDLSADAPTTHKQALVDELLNRAPNSRPGQTEALCKCHLVLQTRPSRQHLIADGDFKALGDLIVERHWATAIKINEDAQGKRLLFQLRHVVTSNIQHGMSGQYIAISSCRTCNVPRKDCAKGLESPTAAHDRLACCDKARRIALLSLLIEVR